MTGMTKDDYRLLRLTKDDWDENRPVERTRDD